MKPFFYTLIFLFLIINLQLTAQTIAEKISVKVSAKAYENPAKIVFSWQSDPGAQYYTINKKAPEATTWGPVIANLKDTATTWIDDNVEVGKTYEYRFVKFNGVGKTSGYGYIYSGINIPEKESRGKIIVLIDSNYVSALKSEIDRLFWDLNGDGWKVIMHYVPRTMTAINVKQIIVADYQKDSEINALLILGHVAVPYSGNLNPDAHPDHQGAWPADDYYGDIDGQWTDNTINNTVASRPQNDNIPGDGKFDQSNIPSDIDLQVGRIDLFGMPAFVLTDTALIKQYLDKNHNFRHGLLTAEYRSLVDDNFAGMDEGFSQTGWRNFSTFFGSDKVTSLDYFSTLATDTYLWSYGCGGGSYTSCSGVGNTNNFASNTVKTIFTVLFGSYFGDWDSDNNFLRAPLASSNSALTSFWAGRPNWHIHHMAMGENIGFSTKLTQNNSNMYVSGYGARWIHVALMGDPTLRMYVVPSPSNLKADSIGNVTVKLTWDASPDPGIIGYNIYHAQSLNDEFVKINSTPITATTYINNPSVDGKNIYMVKAVKLQQSGSGSFYNLSQGIFDSTSTSWPSGIAEKHFIKPVIASYPNPSNGNLNIYIKSYSPENLTISLNNLTGQIINSIEVHSIVGENNFNFSTTPPSKGIYILKIQGSNTSFIEKIIIK